MTSSLVGYLSLFPLSGESAVFATVRRFKETDRQPSKTPASPPRTATPPFRLPTWAANRAASVLFFVHETVVLLLPIEAARPVRCTGAAVETLHFPGSSRERKEREKLL